MNSGAFDVGDYPGDEEMHNCCSSEYSLLSPKPNALKRYPLDPEPPSPKPLSTRHGGPKSGGRRRQENCLRPYPLNVASFILGTSKSTNPKP